MFGYVRVNRDRLSPEDRKKYEAVYCGVCRALGNRYGQMSRWFLNYDFAFLAMLLAPADTEAVTGCRRCAAHPIEGRACCGQGRWLETAAGESVILAWWKIRDAVRDSGFFVGLPARAAGWALAPGYRKARREHPEFDRRTAECLDELSALEKAGSGSLDRTADCFARILAAAAPVSGDQSRDRAVEQLLYHLGRWIYLVDAVDDLEEDRRKGTYNPLIARFPEWSGEDRDYLRRSMDHSLALAGAAFQLLEPNPWHGVMENILYSGLPGVEELVFSGKWREYIKSKGGAANERSLQRAWCRPRSQ